MQYWRPGGNQFVGDCMPFACDGSFHLLYLLDEGHHQALGGLGGHQWAHASTRDLARWERHPLALAIDQPWEGSICTGSVIVHHGVYHAFYATRLPDLTQHLGHATSTDGVHFGKREPRCFFRPPAGFSAVDCRDPCCFAGPDGRFHLAVTAKRDDPSLGQTGGCLLHLTSSDLYTWALEPEPFLPPGTPGLPPGIPECPDVFEWNGTCYLLCGIGLATHCLVGDTLLGPWRPARVPIVDSPTLAVIKTAPFGSGRRIAAGWLGSHSDCEERLLWGGDLILRELVPLGDGSLGTRFVGEAMPRTLPVTALSDGTRSDRNGTILRGSSAPADRVVADCPEHARMTFRVTALAGRPTLRLRLPEASPAGDPAVLTIDQAANTVRLGSAVIRDVLRSREAQQPYTIDIVCIADIVDACIGGARCIVNRRGAARPGPVHAVVTDGDIRIDRVQVAAVAGEAADVH